MVGPKKQEFWPKINILKRKPLYFWHRKLTLKVQFGTSTKKFPLSILIFGQNSCILGQPIFKIPQPNCTVISTYRVKPAKSSLMWSACHKKRYLLCVELTNFGIFTKPFPIFFQNKQNWDSHTGQRQLISDFRFLTSRFVK